MDRLVVVVCDIVVVVVVAAAVNFVVVVVGYIVDQMVDFGVVGVVVVGIGVGGRYVGCCWRQQYVGW